MMSLTIQRVTNGWVIHMYEGGPGEKLCIAVSQEELMDFVSDWSGKAIDESRQHARKDALPG